MNVHRPHPLTGPWPYALDAGAHVARRQGREVSLVERIPTDESRIYNDPDDAVLFDGCDRCAQHASHPTESLDDENLAALWAEMVRVETDPTFVAHYRTAAEGQACRNLHVIARFVERTHPGIDPWVWPWRLAPVHVLDPTRSVSLTGEG